MKKFHKAQCREALRKRLAKYRFSGCNVNEKSPFLNYYK
ncbi:hypothetical protein EMIT036CA2_40350 [Chryseobacterium sp. IT-36CA2]